MEDNDSEADIFKKHPFLFKFIFSFMASAVAETVTYPLDIVKTRIQLFEEQHATKRHGMFRTASDIVKHEGSLQLWKGLSPAIYRHVFYSGIRFALYEQLREKVFRPEEDGHFPMWKAATCGIISGGMAQFVASPTDLVKVLMQMEGLRRLRGQPPRVRNSWHAFQVILHESGFRGLWRGCIPNVQRAALVNMADLATYDSAKRFLRRHTRLEDNYVMHACAATMSGLVAATFGTPADYVKTCVMNQPVVNGRGQLYSSSWDCLKQVLKKQGFFTLYRGFIPIWSRMAPWSLTFWVSYEQIRRLTGAPAF